MLTTPSSDQHCPCGSGLLFDKCCKSYIEGAQLAPTAQALMRSRYSAFALGAVDYLIDTTAPNKRHADDHSVISEQVKNTQWCGLTIRQCKQGQAKDSTGEVEFDACFIANGEAGVLHERSRFYKENNQWLYIDGDVSFDKE